MGGKQLPGKSRKRQEKRRRPVRVVQVTNLPTPQAALSRFISALASALEQVRLPEFAGVNYLLDVALVFGLVFLVNPEIERSLATHYPSLAGPARISTLGVWLALFVWCNVYTVTRSSRRRR